MQFSEHERARNLADRSLVEGIPQDEQQRLEEHTKNCAKCAEYVQHSARIVRGFKAFSLELDSEMNARIQDAVAKRAREDVRAATSDENALIGASLLGRSSQVPTARSPNVPPFAIRRVAFVGVAIAAAVFLVIAVMQHESSRKTPTETRQQSTRAPQVAAKANPSAPAVTSALSTAVSTQSAPVVGRIKRRQPQKALVAEGDFIPLDDGPPVIDGTIVRITMPDSFAVHPHRRHKGNGVPAEVLVDDAGLVRAIRFLD